MSSEGRLGARKLRRIHKVTGVEAIAGWARHPFWEFRDTEDRHYLLNTKYGEWEPMPNPLHYTSCPAIQAVQRKGLR